MERDEKNQSSELYSFGEEIHACDLVDGEGVSDKY